MKKYTLILLFIIPAFFATTLKAQTTPKPAIVKISGEVTTPFDLTPADFAQMKQTEVVRKDRDGNNHTYSGVLLAAILQKAGTTLGKDLRGENLTKYILCEASDGYQVTFALAELDADFTDRLIILADKMDGKPLAPGDGPFRIIVQDEKKPARCMKQVTAIKVAFAK
jgi:DMSO/TMAO reductase YedYZ molybdopterin-dependent catalytic subunit